MADVKVIYERVDDIPVLFGIMKQLELPEIFDTHLGQHGNHRGLSNGWLLTVWLAFILSEGDHCKSHVQEWVWKRRRMVSKLIGQPIRWDDFTDDRLGIALGYVSRQESWEGIEEGLWRQTVVVHTFKIAGVRLDSTTSSGYHKAVVDQVMQYGHSKDHRPDLTQVKLMLAVAEPRGQVIASQVHSGEKADDPLYVPLMHRVRKILGASGMLYTGDCKMAALETRADIVAHHDYYLTVLPLTGETREQIDSWIGAVVDGDQEVTLFWDDERLLGGGYEFSRPLTGQSHGQAVSWIERVELVRSCSLAHSQSQALEHRLQSAKMALQKLTPEPGKGKRQIREEGKLLQAIEKILATYRVTGLLDVSWQREEQVTTRYVGRGRGGPHRPTRIEKKVRYVITGVLRKEADIAAAKYRLGWRVQVTNLPQEILTLAQCVLHYRAGYCVEGDFRMLKGKPIGIRPLYVRTDAQIRGLTHLLTVALRILTCIQMKAREELAKEDTALAGLYEGQPSRTTTCPTARRLLRAFVREEITLAYINVEGQEYINLSPLSDVLGTILTYLGLCASLYTRLIQNSS
jgi:transposase